MTACAVTASINLIWGCKFMSPATGIIMNNQMDDFAIPGVIRYQDPSLCKGKSVRVEI